MVRHPHFTQPIFVRFPRPAVLRGREGVERFPPGAGAARSPRRWPASCAQLDRRDRRPTRCAPLVEGRREDDVRRALARHAPDPAGRRARLLHRAAGPAGRAARCVDAARSTVRPVPSGADPYQLAPAPVRRLPRRTRCSHSPTRETRPPRRPPPRLPPVPPPDPARASTSGKPTSPTRSGGAVDGVIAARPDVGHRRRRPVPLGPAHQRRDRVRLPAVPAAARGAARTRPSSSIAGNHDTPALLRDRVASSGCSRSSGVDVAADEAAAARLTRRSTSSVLAVPHQALVEPRAARAPARGRRAAPGAGAARRGRGPLPVRPAGASSTAAPLVTPEELAPGGWSYVALGHYHVQHQVAPRVWYSGALEYVSTNTWGELADEAASTASPARAGCWSTSRPATVTPQPVPLARRVIDLPPLDATGRTRRELDAADRATGVAAVPGRHRRPDRAAGGARRAAPRRRGSSTTPPIRACKAEALHFQLDLRRPEPHRETGVGRAGPAADPARDGARTTWSGGALPARDRPRAPSCARGVELMDAGRARAAEG